MVPGVSRLSFVRSECVRDLLEALGQLTREGASAKFDGVADERTTALDQTNTNTLSSLAQPHERRTAVELIAFGDDQPPTFEPSDEAARRRHRGPDTLRDLTHAHGAPTGAYDYERAPLRE